MPTAPDLSREILQALRRQIGVLSSAKLQDLLGVSQPTVSRALATQLWQPPTQAISAASRRIDCLAASN